MTDTYTSARYGGLTPGYYWFFIIFMVLLSSFGSFVNDMYISRLCHR